MIEVAHVTKPVGLTRPTGGHVTIGGHRYADLVDPGRHVGVLLGVLRVLRAEVK